MEFHVHLTLSLNLTLNLFIYILVLITSFISNSWRQFSLQMLYTQMPVDLVGVCIKYWANKRRKSNFGHFSVLFSSHFTIHTDTNTCESQENPKLLEMQVRWTIRMMSIELIIFLSVDVWTFFSIALKWESCKRPFRVGF